MERGRRKRKIRKQSTYGSTNINNVARDDMKSPRLTLVNRARRPIGTNRKNAIHLPAGQTGRTGGRADHTDRQMHPNGRVNQLPNNTRPIGRVPVTRLVCLFAFFFVLLSPSLPLPLLLVPFLSVPRILSARQRIAQTKGSRNGQSVDRCPHDTCIIGDRFRGGIHSRPHPRILFTRHGHCSQQYHPLPLP